MKKICFICINYNVINICRVVSSNGAIFNLEILTGWFDVRFFFWFWNEASIIKLMGIFLIILKEIV